MEPSLSELLQTSVQLMIVGMGIVYLFLALLVGAVTLLPALLRRLDGEPVFERVSLAAMMARLRDREVPVEVDEDTRAAIQDAIQRYETQT